MQSDGIVEAMMYWLVYLPARLIWNFVIGLINTRNAAKHDDGYND